MYAYQNLIQKDEFNYKLRFLFIPHQCNVGAHLYLRLHYISHSNALVLWKQYTKILAELRSQCMLHFETTNYLSFSNQS